MCGEGVCMAKEGMHGKQDMHGEGGHAWQREGGMCGEGDMHGRVGGIHDREACVPGEMATAADGTYPTGMHSCCMFCKRRG